MRFLNMGICTVHLGKKKSYPQSIGKWFVPSRLSTEQQDSFHNNFEVNHKPEGEKISVYDLINVIIFIQITRFSSLQYSIKVTKFDRHGYESRDRYLVLTNAAVYLLDVKDCKIKHRLTFADIAGITVTNGNDNLLLIRLAEASIKTNKGDLILDCDFLVETLTWIIDTCGNKNILSFEAATSYYI